MVLDKVCLLRGTGGGPLLWGGGSLRVSLIYRHIRNCYLSNSKTFQDGNGNGNFWKLIQMTFEMVIGNQWK